MTRSIVHKIEQFHYWPKPSDFPVFYYYEGDYNTDVDLPPSFRDIVHFGCLRDAVVRFANVNVNVTADHRIQNGFFLVNLKFKPMMDFTWHPASLKCNDDKINVFRVRPTAGYPPLFVSPHAELDEYAGGTYFVGGRFSRLVGKVLGKYPPRVFDSMLHFIDHETSMSTYPYEVHILNSGEPFDVIDRAVLSTQYVLTNARIYSSSLTGSIRENHAYLVNRVAENGSVLVVDADFEFDKRTNFNHFPYHLGVGEEQFAFLWYARNPCNGLVYGHGAPKLFSKPSFFHERAKGPDMTTTVAHGLTVKQECVGTHAFNWSEESTWRTAFREAYKLTAADMSSTENTEARQRLHTWLDDRSYDYKSSFWQACLKGAQLGNKYAKDQSIDSNTINQYDRLHKLYLRHHLGVNDEKDQDQ